MAGSGGLSGIERRPACIHRKMRCRDFEMFGGVNPREFGHARTMTGGCLDGEGVAAAS